MELVNTMRSVVIEQPGRLAFQTRALPQPAAGEVRIKVKFAGICGSDVHIYHGHNPFARYPRVIGHEFFGQDLPDSPDFVHAVSHAYLQLLSLGAKAAIAALPLTDREVSDDRHYA